ncbi:PEP-CTERM sorting domain-containing protein [Iningainema tapete]|uniref:PEP-CTERM sorting domain-containing protein n=1 Tax=Iningainema tapete BLCC-T55 TaxID=2748662 RepID=A0A8J6XYA1_9CYAN|nr:PEP-CTERM sorting domain-containing protein [Iningainema tapete]MBD2775273.1 PEP-CTERM sorting domain-containing protein [Iningainema tapete BLCC-T55]
MKAKQRLFMAAVGAIVTLLGTVSNAPAQAALFDFQFQFNAQETGEPVSGNFVIDDSIPAGRTPDGGTLYGNASPNYNINVGNNVFQGSSNSIVVARNFARPDNSSLSADVIGFDDFRNFNPSNPQFLATFAFAPNSLRSDALSDLQTAPSTALALINTPTGATLSSVNALTKITPVPEPASTLGVLTLCVVGIGSILKRKQQFN